MSALIISRGRLPFVAVEAVGAVSRRSQARRAGRVWRCDACHKLSVLSGRVCCGSGSIRRLYESSDYPFPRRAAVLV